MASVHSVMVYVPAFTFPAHILKYGLGALLHIMLHFTLFTPLNIHVVFESCKVFFSNFTSKKEQLILLQKNDFVCSDYAMLFFIIGCWGGKQIKLFTKFVFQKNGHEDILKKVSFSIPIFHCYGHGVPCQVICHIIYFYFQGEKGR